MAGSLGTEPPVVPSEGSPEQLARLDELVQDVLDTPPSPDAALAALAAIEDTPLDRPWPVLLVAYAIAGAALTTVLGGGVSASLLPIHRGAPGPAGDQAMAS